MKKLLTAGMLLAGGVLAVACFYEEKPPAPAPAPMLPASSAAVLSPAQAAQILGEARCDREAMCNNIGPTAQYLNRDHCVSVMRADAEQNLRGCEYGVKDRELRACVNEIHSHACGGVVNPLDWFQRLVTCQSNNLCLH